MTPRTTLKIAVFAPMPRPSVTITASAKPRDRAKLRSAKRRSDMSMGFVRLKCHAPTRTSFVAMAMTMKRTMLS